MRTGMKLSLLLPALLCRAGESTAADKANLVIISEDDLGYEIKEKGRLR